MVTLLMHAGVEFKLNTTVTAADVKAKTLTTAAGDTISYEKLVIATGSGVRFSRLNQKAVRYKASSPFVNLSA